MGNRATQTRLCIGKQMWVCDLQNPDRIGRFMNEASTPPTWRKRQDCRRQQPQIIAVCIRSDQPESIQTGPLVSAGRANSIILPSFCLVTIVFWFEWSVFFHADIIGLFVAQFRDLSSDTLKMQSRNLFVEMLR